MINYPKNGFNTLKQAFYIQIVNNYALKTRSNTDLNPIDVILIYLKSINKLVWEFLFATLFNSKAWGFIEFKRFLLKYLTTLYSSKNSKSCPHVLKMIQK